MIPALQSRTDLQGHGLRSTGDTTWAPACQAMEECNARDEGLAELVAAWPESSVRDRELILLIARRTR
jgi:hypothetical protein